MIALERIAEEKIREAIAAGEFDNLPGKGKPLVFDDPVGLRPELRLAYIVLKSSGFLPEDLYWRKELESRLLALQRFREHCRARLGHLLERFRTETRENSGEQIQPPKAAFFAWGIKWRRKTREQNSARQRGKKVGWPGSRSTTAAVRRAYFEERRWLRSRLQELASRAAEAAQRLQDILIEKEIRDRRPLSLILYSPIFSSEKILSDFDREYPFDLTDGSEGRI